MKTEEEIKQRISRLIEAQNELEWVLRNEKAIKNWKKPERVTFNLDKKEPTK